MVEISSETAVWYSTGLFAVPLRWVLVRDAQKEFKTQALLCADLNADPQRIVCWFVMRWQLEVSFQEVRRPKRDLKPKGSGRRWRSEGPPQRS
jgi:hypothetical protein